LLSRSFTDRYHQGLVLYNQKRFREASEFFEYYLRHDSDGEFAPEASYFWGRSLQRRGKYGSAIGVYQRAIDAGQEGEYFAEAWLKMAYCERVRGDLQASLTTYRRFVEAHPDHEAAHEVMWQEARLLEEKQLWSDAERVYEQLYTQYQDSDHAGDAHFRRALCLYKRREYRESQAVLAELFVSGNDDALARALFWSGKCKERLRRTDEAHECYREAREMGGDSYYGRRARDRLVDLGLASGNRANSEGPLGHPWRTGSDVDDANDSERVRTSETNSDRNPRPHNPFAGGSLGSQGAEDIEFAIWLAGWYESAYFITDRLELRRTLSLEPAFVRADIFLGLHMRDEAQSELTSLQEFVGNDPRRLDILVEYCREAGLNRRAILLAERILAISPAEDLSEAPAYLRKRICPKHFTDTVDAECDEKGIDPNLFYSLMRQESLFEPEAVSWVGARGLTQIMPRTGRWIARRLGTRHYRTADLMSPDLNIEFGTYYFSVQVEEFDGDILRALAAYNGGPDNVKRWWDYGGAEDVDVFVEDIGFSQTAHYVGRVYRYRGIYEDTYGH
jgi:TolA-binding protein